MNWLLIGGILSLGTSLGFILGAWWASRPRDLAARILRDLEEESERAVRHGTECPWDIQR